MRVFIEFFVFKSKLIVIHINIVYLSSFCSSWHSDFNCSSCPVHRCFADSSMDAMLSWIILFFLNSLWSFSWGIVCFLINSNSFSIKDSFFSSWFLNKFANILLWSSFFIVKRRCKINLNISINNANGIILIFWFDF